MTFSDILNNPKDKKVHNTHQPAWPISTSQNKPFNFKSIHCNWASKRLGKSSLLILLCSSSVLLYSLLALVDSSRVLFFSSFSFLRFFKNAAVSCPAFDNSLFQNLFQNLSWFSLGWFYGKIWKEKTDDDDINSVVHGYHLAWSAMCWI